MTEVQEYLQGQVVDGRFPLVQYLGGTQHSAVFLTEYAAGKNQRAAIKLVEAPPGNAEAQLIRWRLAARLSHPHLLRIFEMDRCKMDNAAMLYVVMECADENLADILRERSLLPLETRDMLGPILEALGYIHSKGFVHGHIRPSNIMAIGDQVKLSSDGICRIDESVVQLSGQSRYCAPERALGVLSPASDVWSLGVTLVECLSAHLPNAEQSAEEEVSLLANLPASFRDLARHCLNPEPQRRWNVAELKVRLQRNHFAEQEEAAPVRQNEPPKRRYALASTALSLIVATILLGITVLNHGPNKGRIRSAGLQSDAKPLNVAPAKAQSFSAMQIPHLDKGSSAGKDVHAAAGTSPALHSPAAGSLVRGEAVHRQLPDVPRNASDTIWGTVRVRVRVAVDSLGNVVGANFDSTGPSRYFAGLSMAAAREWKFKSPSLSGKNLPSAWVIRFAYTKSETEATGVEENP
ncbi:MAG: serine/threonine-protein kinase [Candidatus Acidiferrales bacterium]